MNETEWLYRLREATPPHVLQIAERVWNERDAFLRWPSRQLCFAPGCIRARYHQYTPQQKEMLKSAGIGPDTRSNGPAVMAFLLAGGERPGRVSPGKCWSVHHIYDGKFPAPGHTSSAHAVKDPLLFTEASGLVAAHPIADALADEVPYFAWLLRREAYARFRLDPDNVFSATTTLR